MCYINMCHITHHICYFFLSVPQVYIDQILSTVALGYYLIIYEWMRNITFCVVIDGPQEEPLQIHVETTHANGNKYLPALGKFASKLPNHVHGGEDKQCGKLAWGILIIHMLCLTLCI